AQRAPCGSVHRRGGAGRRPRGTPAAPPMMAAASEVFEGQQLAPSLKILLALTLLAVLPAIILTTTSFVRTVVVLSFIRQGLGAPQTPPNQVIIGLSLFISLFPMSPVWDQVKVAAYEPYLRDEITEMEALERASVPLKRFMLRQTREEDLRLFYSA